MQNLAFSLFKALVHMPIEADGSILVNLRAPSVTGTVQDDPFDEWTNSRLLESNLFEKINYAGKLTSPDIVLYYRNGRSFLGLEVKKLDAKDDNTDPRGLTLDYNSTVPCGKMNIKVNNKSELIETFYYFALLKGNSEVITTVICHGDFLNNDLNFHLESKTSNESTYKHGSYGEASIRHRNMYNFPNPLNSKIDLFAQHHSFIIPPHLVEPIPTWAECYARYVIQRESIDGEVSEFVVLSTNTTMTEGSVLTGVFDACKERTKKKRVSYSVQIEIK